MSGILTVTGLAAGLLSGEKEIGPENINGAATVGQISDVTLSTGDNTLTVPAGATAVLLVVSSSNQARLQLRSNLNSGDTGTPFGPNGFVVWPLFTGTTSLIVNAASGGAAIEATFI